MRTWNRNVILFSFIACHLFVPSYASSIDFTHAVISVGAGAALSFDFPKSHFIPIQNPVTDEFFQYSAHDETETKLLADVFFGIEGTLNPCWELQLGLDYNQIAHFTTHGRLTQGADQESADSFSYHYRVLTRQVLAEGKLLYNYQQIYHPYFMAGLGVSFNKAYNFNTSVPPDLTFTRNYNNHTSTSFSYAVGFGMDADITPYLRAGIGYRFADAGHFKLGEAVIDTTPVSHTLSQSHLYTNQLLAQLTLII